MPKHTVRVEITRPTRCDLRGYGEEDARVESVSTGEVYEVTNECFLNLTHSAACVETTKEIKNRFVKPVVAPPAKPVVAPPAKPVVAPPAKPVVATGSPAVLVK